MRCTFSMMASSSASPSVTSRTTIGTSCSLARCAARQRRSPAMISNALALPFGRPHHDRLDDAALADRARQLVELVVGKILARVFRIGPDVLDRHLALRLARRCCAPSPRSLAGASTPTSPISAARPRPSRDGLSAMTAAPRFTSRSRSGCCALTEPLSTRTRRYFRIRQPAAANSRSRWMISVASRRYASLPTHLRS